MIFRPEILHKLVAFVTVGIRVLVDGGIHSLNVIVIARKDTKLTRKPTTRKQIRICNSLYTHGVIEIAPCVWLF